MAKTYDTYKDSGIAWIGEIPGEWRVDILSLHLYDHCLYNDHLKENNLLSLSYGRIIRKDINTKEGLLPSSFNRYNIIDNGDIVLRLTDLQNDKKSLRTGLCKERGIITSAYLTLRNRGYDDSSFLHYLLHTYDLCKVFYGMGNGVRQGMNYSDVRKFKIPCPPLSVQQSISSFLDTKCGEIDSLISLQEEMISELQAYKQSVITEAVTKGLDKNVKMKDSGVEWIGEIPESWEVLPHKQVMHKVKDIQKHYNGEDIISLTMNGVIVRDLSAGGKIPLTFDGYQKVYPGNLLLCLFDIDVTPRCVGLIKNAGVTSPAYSQFEVHKGEFAPYYDYLLRFMDDYKCLLHLSKNLRSSLTETDFGFIPTIRPPYDEQSRIATYLDTKTAEIDSLIALKQQKITELKDYKKSIIYEYVTGKKEVSL